MERATNNIKDPKAKAYFEDVANGKQPAFIDKERKQFREALQDINKKLSAVAMVL